MASPTYFTGASINDGDVIPIMMFLITLSGTFGFVNDNLPAGATAAANYNTSSATVTITVSSIGFNNDSGDNINNPLTWSRRIPCRHALPDVESTVLPSRTERALSTIGSLTLSYAMLNVTGGTLNVMAPGYGGQFHQAVSRGQINLQSTTTNSGTIKIAGPAVFCRRRITSVRSASTTRRWKATQHSLLVLLRQYGGWSVIPSSLPW
ncbi:MAG: hypothetical protein U5O39_11915 [Gammaproteobacteria bacterium]|nr:hypothetical protein [Gammaproteobacteria bacterium]